MTGHTIKLEEVTKIFTLGILGRNKIVAVDRASFEIRTGEILSILGESGSGKSTIARMVLRLLRPSSGRILFDGRDIWRMKRWSEIKEYYRRVQGVFQDPYSSFNPRRKILDLLFDTVYNTFPEMKKNREEALKYIDETLAKVGLSIEALKDKYPHQVSGGQLQRAAIARALLPKPIFIIADEPVSMVDASTRIDILNIFIDLKEQEGVSPVVIGHDYSLAYYVSDRIIVLYRGQIVEEGAPEVLEDPLHPYTKMLKESVPMIDRKWSKKLEYSLGEITITRRRKGCIFADRCPYKKPVCEEREPPLFQVGKERVKCWLYGEK